MKQINAPVIVMNRAGDSPVPDLWVSDGLEKLAGWLATTDPRLPIQLESTGDWLTS